MNLSFQIIQYKCFGGICILNIREFCNKTLYSRKVVEVYVQGGLNFNFDGVRKFKIIIIIKINNNKYI